MIMMIIIILLVAVVISLHYEVESFFRSRQSLSRSKIPTLRTPSFITVFTRNYAASDLEPDEHRTHVTNAVEQSFSWEASTSSGIHEVPRMLRNPWFHYSFEKVPPLVHILNQPKRVYNVLSCFFKNDFSVTDCSHPRIDLPSNNFLATFLIKTLSVFPLSPILAIRPAILAVLHWSP